MNASEKVSRHGHDERIRVLGACNRLGDNFCDAAYASAVRLYGQHTVNAAVAYKVQKEKEAEIRNSTGPIKLLHQNAWMLVRVDDVNRYLTDYRVPPSDKDRPDVDMRNAQSAVCQLDADSSAYGIDLAIQIHGQAVIDEIMVWRLFQLRAEAQKNGLNMSRNEIMLGLTKQFMSIMAEAE